MSILDGMRELDAERKRDVEIDSPAKYCHLEKAIKVWLNSRPPREPGTDWLRASGLHSLCPRQFVLNYWHPRPHVQFDWASILRMNIGSYLHYFMQNQVLGPMGVLYGTWWNKKTGVRVGGFHPEPEVDWDTTEITWEFQEETVRDEHLRIEGHLDGMVSVERIAYLYEMGDLHKRDPEECMRRMWSMSAGTLVPFELKTVSNYGYTLLEGPKDIAGYYKMQSCIYQKLKGEKRMVFLFINRDTVASKTMLYNYEPGWWRDAKRKAQIVWEAIRDETLPENGMKCHTPTDKRAKNCLFHHPCWLAEPSDFRTYVEEGKIRADESGRKLLDLTGWKP